MKNAQHRPPLALIGNGRCDYLGLKDDPQTCLAFTSNWNYCHRVRPPDSVRIEHQRQYCLTADHVQCPIFQNEKAGPLPSAVRGRHSPRSGRKKRIAGRLAWLLIIVSALLFLWFAKTPASLDQIKFRLFGETRVGNLPSVTEPATSSPVRIPQTESPAIVYPLAPTVISAPTKETPPPDNKQTPEPTPVGVCGYLLDKSFGGEHKFVIHQAQPGESLGMYASEYQTSVNAILAVNYSLPVPLQEKWVLVIPVGETQTQELPVFEPYLASETDGSAEELAGKLSTDLTALKLYNAFDESCRTFSGWLLVPRQKPSP